MKMNDEKLLAFPKQAVWDALNDLDVLKACIPGCESIVPSGEGFEVKLVAAVGPVKARFKGRMQLKDVRPPDSYAISFDGQGGAAGYGRGEAHVDLSAPSASTTLLKYTCTASVGGKLAQIGSRLVDMAAQKMAADFFNSFENELARKYGMAPQPPQHAELSWWTRLKALVARWVGRRMPKSTNASTE